MQVKLEESKDHLFCQKQEHLMHKSPKHSIKEMNSSVSLEVKFLLLKKKKFKLHKLKEGENR